MNSFYVTFRWYDTDTYCTNICIAENKDMVHEHYSKYNNVSVREATAYEVETAKVKGMPIIKLS
jgi:hypothetical protein